MVALTQRPAEPREFADDEAVTALEGVAQAGRLARRPEPCRGRLGRGDRPWWAPEPCPPRRRMMAGSRAGPSSRPKRSGRRGGARLEACGQQVRVRPERLGPVMATTCRSPPAVRRGRGPVRRRPSPTTTRSSTAGSRLPALGASSPSTPFAVRSWGLDEHRELPVGRRRRQSVPADGADTPAMKSSFAITASSRSSSSAIFSPTRRQRPATPRRWR